MSTIFGFFFEFLLSMPLIKELAKMFYEIHLPPNESIEKEV